MTTKTATDTPDHGDWKLWCEARMMIKKFNLIAKMMHKLDPEGGTLNQAQKALSGWW